MSTASAAPGAVAAPASASPWLWFVAGVLGTAALGAGGTALYLGQHATPTPVVTAAAAPAATPAAVAATVAPAAPVTTAPVVKQKVPAARTHIAQTAPKTVATEAPAEVADTTSHSARPVPHQPQVLPTQDWPRPQALCAHCGTVESVTPIPAEGTPSGVGAVAGAVLGGLLGNQFGGGDGKTLATIGGVLGGAYAGNTVEKRMHQQTRYRVVVRMDDGSRRSLEQASPSVGVGMRVQVQGETLSPVSNPV